MANIAVNGGVHYSPHTSQMSLTGGSLYFCPECFWNSPPKAINECYN